MRDDLSLLEAQLIYKRRLEAMLKELYSQRDSLRAKAEHLKQSMLSERKDVDRLEGRSLFAFFYHMAGKMDAKLDSQRREYYAARVKYDAAVRELEAIEQDIESTEEDLADLADCETRYARVLEEKRIAIESAHTPEAEALIRREQEVAYLSAQERELEEAITAGTQALRLMADVMQQIETAKDWAALDLPGGKFLADLARHDILDESQKKIEQLQIQLQRFNRELSDVSIRPGLQLSIDEMLLFADGFLEGILSDTAMPERIRQAYGRAEQTREDILVILRQLQTRLEEVRHHQTATRHTLDAMILNAQL